MVNDRKKCFRPSCRKLKVITNWWFYETLDVNWNCPDPRPPSRTSNGAPLRHPSEPRKAKSIGSRQWWMQAWQCPKNSNSQNQGLWTTILMFTVYYGILWLVHVDAKVNQMMSCFILSCSHKNVIQPSKGYSFQRARQGTLWPMKTFDFPASPTKMCHWMMGKSTVREPLL